MKYLSYWLSNITLCFALSNHILSFVPVIYSTVCGRRMSEDLWGPQRFSCHPRAFGVSRPFLINLRAHTRPKFWRWLVYKLPKVSVAYPSLWMQFRAWSSANASTSNVLIKSLAIAGDCACNSCFMTSLTSATGSRPGSVNGQSCESCNNHDMFWQGRRRPIQEFA